VPDAVRAAVAADPDLLLLWGGDGTVQRALDTVARKAMPDVPIAVLPAGASTSGCPVACPTNSTAAPGAPPDN